MPSCRELIDLPSSIVQFISGNSNAISSQVCTPQNLTANSTVFVTKKGDLDAALASDANIIIALQKIMANVDQMPPPKAHQALFGTKNISQAMAYVLPLFEDTSLIWPSNQHSTAIIHPSAKIGQHVSIGAYSIIEADVKIGDNVQIDHHVVIKANSKIGAGSKIHSFAYIGPTSEIGINCEIQPHATIGSDGYGYSKTSSGENIRIPQLGKVVLGNNVTIGASSCVDRATLTQTEIGDGTKLDNLCHIAHNTKLGKQGFFTAGFMTAGSVEVGDNFACGGMVGIADHIKITDNVTLGGRTTVTRHLSEPGAYMGYPVEPMQQGLKTLLNLTKLSEMRKELTELKKQSKPALNTSENDTPEGH